MKRTRGEKFISFLLFVVIALGISNRQMIAQEVRGLVGRGEYALTRIKTVTLDYDLENAVIPAFYPLYNDIVTLEGTRLTLYNHEGEAQWQVVNDFSQVLIGGNENFFAVANQESGDLYVYDYRSDIKARTLGLGEIKGIAVTEKGYIIVQVGEGGLEIFDPRLNLVATLRINQGEITRVAFNEADDQIYLVGLDMASGQVNTTLYKYGVAGDLVGSVELADEVVFDLFFEDLTLIKVSDLEIGVIGEDLLMKKQIPFTGLVDRAVYGHHRLVLQNFDQDSKNMGRDKVYDLLVYDTLEEKVSFKRSYEEAFIGMTFFNENILCYSNNTIMLYDLNGILLGEFNLGRDFTKLAVLEKGRIFIQGVDYFEIHTLEKQ